MSVEEGPRPTLAPAALDVAPPPMSLRAARRPNPVYRTFAVDRAITIQKRPLLRAGHSIFTMGSCFAEEIRLALAGQGWACLPEYRRVAFDPTRIAVDTLPDREHMNFYNTFSVLAQLEKAAGIWAQDPEDFWHLPGPFKKSATVKGSPLYQDPYLRLVIADSPDLLLEVRRRIEDEIRRSLYVADAFIFTFGMTEVFRNRSSGRIVCQKPGYGGGGGREETEPHFSGFKENLRNVRSIVSLVRSIRPDAPILMSVSPVALSLTAGRQDIVTTNFEAKAILRAVVGQVCREFHDVVYVPSLEFVTLQGASAYRPDFRHVLRPVVEEIVRGFTEAFVE